MKHPMRSNVGRKTIFSFRNRLLFWLAPLLFLVTVFPIYNAYAQLRLEREIAAQDRDPVSGVMIGAEALTLPATERAVLAGNAVAGPGSTTKASSYTLSR